MSVDAGTAAETVRKTMWDRKQAFTRIKLCEFESLDASYPAVQMGAHALGFHIFHTHDVAQRLALFEGIFRFLPRTTERVLLTDLTARELLEQVLPRIELDGIQLYPDWRGDELASFRDRVPKSIRLWKVMSAKDEENFTPDPDEFLAAYEDHVDAILLDSARRGGTGELANLDHCASIVQKSRLPVFLAGGLRPENVGAAIERVKPFGVDVETGVSDRIPNGPLIKNLTKCERFIDAVRRADAALGRT